MWYCPEECFLIRLALWMQSGFMKSIGFEIISVEFSLVASTTSRIMPISMDLLNQRINHIISRNQNTEIHGNIPGVLYLKLA